MYRLTLLASVACFATLASAQDQVPAIPSEKAAHAHVQHHQKAHHTSGHHHVATAHANAHKEMANLHVNELVVAKNVHNRTPQDVGTTFTPQDQRVHAFASIHSSEATTLHFVWTRNGKVHAKVPVHVGVAKSWRTFSSVKALPGSWTVALVDASGNSLQTADFTVA
jgi:hypothetical protein